MNLGFSPMMSLNFTPVLLSTQIKPGSPFATEFAQAAAIVQKVPTTQVPPVAPISSVSAVERGDVPQSAAERAASQEHMTKPNLERDPVEEFKKYMALSPAEKMRLAFLDESDISTERYQSLPPEEKTKIDEAIAQRLRDSKQDTGLSSVQSAAGIAQYQMEMQRGSMGSNSISSQIAVFV
ncbi:hypothetical protein [Saccharospirillum mangrovi]|uniref:hypothetical protein n=1 Tax=Saccharospirillum mangrovi TaxID=2161747 RepID=UPI000D3923A7|nr:hypothetical protein [Saccharospirillum mangrovi]